MSRRQSAAVFWMPMQNVGSHPTTGMNWTDNRTVHPDGRVERLPILAHAGDDYEERREHPQARKRYVMIVRHEGHTVPLLLTNGAPHLDTTTTFATSQKLKALALGWFLWRVPLCRQIKNGGVRRDKIMATELLTSKKLCKAGDYPEGCRCAKKEITARRAAQTEVERVRHAPYVAQATGHDAAIASAAAKGIASELRAVLGEMKGGS